MDIPVKAMAGIILSLFSSAHAAQGTASAGICQGVFAKQLWCDPTRSIEERVDDMIARMSLEDKVASLASSDNAAPSLGLPTYNWRSEVSHCALNHT